MPATIRLKSLFFNTAAVTNPAGRATIRALFQQSSYIRTSARRSMKRVSGSHDAAPPGHPPFARKGQIRDLMAFDVDRLAKTAVIGPQKFGGNRAPHALEFSGIINRRNRRTGRRTPRRYQARPFMAPALDKSLPKFPNRWANSIRG